MRNKVITLMIVLAISGIFIFLPVGRYKSYVNIADGSMVYIRVRFGIWKTVTHSAPVFDLSEFHTVTHENVYLIYSWGGSNLWGSWDSWGDGQKYLHEINTASSLYYESHEDSLLIPDLQNEISKICRRYLEKSKVFAIDKEGCAIPFVESRINID